MRSCDNTLFVLLFQTRVNLLTKLKDQVDITYSTEIIKTLKILPKSWTNEEIEQRAMQVGLEKLEQFTLRRPGSKMCLRLLLPTKTLFFVQFGICRTVNAAQQSKCCKKRSLHNAFLLHRKQSFVQREIPIASVPASACSEYCEFAHFSPGAQRSCRD